MAFNLQRYMTDGVARVVKDALRSPLFRALQDDGLLLDDHVGGCTLHMNKDKVEAILQQGTA